MSRSPLTKPRQTFPAKRTSILDRDWAVASLFSKHLRFQLDNREQDLYEPYCGYGPIQVTYYYHTLFVKPIEFCNISKEWLSPTVPQRQPDSYFISHQICPSPKAPSTSHPFSQGSQDSHETICRFKGTYTSSCDHSTRNQPGSRFPGRQCYRGCCHHSQQHYSYQKSCIPQGRKEEKRELEGAYLQMQQLTPC